MKVAFDEEVSSQKAEEFTETVLSLRWPETHPHILFAFSAFLPTAVSNVSTKHKYGTMR